MRFLYVRASNWDDKGEVVINDISDLREFCREQGHDHIVLDLHEWDEKQPTLIIYDDYME